MPEETRNALRSLQTHFNRASRIEPGDSADEQKADVSEEDDAPAASGQQRQGAAETGENGAGRRAELAR
jgi:hypothetical protein